MKKKLLILGVVTIMGVALCGCSLIDKIKGKSSSSDGTKGVKIENEETGGLYYLFGGKKFDGSDFALGDIIYQGPEFGNVIRDENRANAFVQTNDKQVLFVWFDGESTAESCTEVMDKFGGNILSAIRTDLGFADGSAYFDGEAEEATTANNLERVHFKGNINCYTEDKEEMILPFDAYSFVVNGKAGCVISVITAKEKAEDYQEEIEHNSLVLMNTIVASK